MNAGENSGPGPRFAVTAEEKFAEHFFTKQTPDQQRRPA
jgi:hypothetical protein